MCEEENESKLRLLLQVENAVEVLEQEKSKEKREQGGEDEEHQQVRGVLTRFLQLSSRVHFF